jgi:two-component system response regulator FlrC
LTTHRWAGNIRELENVLQRALILARGDVIEPGDLHLPATVAADRQGLPHAGALPPAVSVSDARTRAAATAPLDIKSLERKHILDALSAAQGSRRKAAAQLQMSERTLRHKLAQYRADGWLDGAGQHEGDDAVDGTAQ